MIGEHYNPHFNAAGLCTCDCRPCTSLGWCCCPDCPCDGMGDRGDEHVPDGCGELVTGLRVVALMPALSPPSWFPLTGGGLRPPSPMFGTYCLPTAFIPIRSREEIIAGERREVAGKVLAVLREAAPKARSGRVRRLGARTESTPAAAAPAGQACASCVLGNAPRLPLGFPLVPPSGP